MTEFRTKKPTLPKAFLLLLLALAALGNYLEISLFFGVDFIFGSIFVLIAVAMYGPFWGFLLSIVPAIELYYLWGHPYAVIAPLGEAVFVGNFLKRYQTNLVLSGMVYWIFIGIPLIFSLYLIGLKMDPGDALLAALKSGSNGVVNSICASLIVTYVAWLYRPLGHPDRGITLFETLFNSFIAVTLIPIFTLLTIDARRGVGEMEQNIKGHLSEIGTALSLSIEAWKGEQIRSIEMLANVIEKENGNNTDSMQLWLEQHQRIWGNFLGAFVTDQHGITIAFDPLRNIKGESTIGLSFADRQYFQAMKRGDPSPHVSGVFMARGGVFQPVFNVTSRIRRGGKFLGIVSGSMNLNDISQLLKSVPLGVDYFAIVIDADGHVISSTSSDFRPLEKYKNFDAIMDHTGKSQVYHRWPEISRYASTMQRWKGSFYGQRIEIPGAGAWKLFVEVPVRGEQEVVFFRYLKIFGLFLFLAVVLLITAYLVANRISQPLRQLSLETTDIPERLRLDQKINWPKSSLLEVSALVKNFHDAIDALNRRLQDLETSRTQLDQANRSKDEFLSIASHELKTPLTPLKMQIQMLSRKLVQDRGKELPVDSITRSLGLADLQVNRLIRLIDDLLDVARINAGKLKLSKERIDLTSLVREVVERYEPQLRGAGCDVSLEVPERLDVLVDPLRVEQVLVNLLTNAAKYAAGKPVLVALKEAPEEMSLIVKDQGPGIPKEARERVFERFERFSTKDTLGGLGLGLFISRQIVEAHGGRIEVMSEPGLGSTFKVTLPRVELALPLPPRNLE